MDIGKEGKPIIIEPAVTPVPQREPAPARRKPVPRKEPTPARKPVKEPVKR
jgi:hypothetical protein